MYKNIINFVFFMFREFCKRFKNSHIQAGIYLSVKGKHFEVFGNVCNKYLFR